MDERAPPSIETQTRFLFNQGVARHRQGDREGAVKYYKEALALEPPDLRMRRLIEWRIKDHNEAERHRKAGRKRWSKEVAVSASVVMRSA